MLVAAFIASGVLEVVGVGLVLDIRRERNAARRLLEVRASEQVELDRSSREPRYSKAEAARKAGVSVARIVHHPFTHATSSPVLARTPFPLS